MSELVELLFADIIQAFSVFKTSLQLLEILKCKVSENLRME